MSFMTYDFGACLQLWLAQGVPASRQEGSAYASLAHAQVCKPESRVLGFKLHFAVCRFCSAAGEQRRSWQASGPRQAGMLDSAEFRFGWRDRLVFSGVLQPFVARLRPYTIPAVYVDIPPLRGAEEFQFDGPG